MFTWLNSQAVRSDRGFEVESMGRFSVHYREGNKTVDVYVERGLDNGKPCVVIEPLAFIRWDGDPEFVTLPKDKQQQMLRNFIDAMEFQGLAVVVT
jgi:hypothetical protein